MGSPNYIIYNPETNFISKEFWNNTKIIGILYKEMPVEAYWAVGKVKRLHGLLRRVYKILKAKIGYYIDKEIIL